MADPKKPDPKVEPAPEGNPPAAAHEPASAAHEPASAEHPRRVNPPGERYGDKQLRQGRIRGGFDTK